MLRSWAGVVTRGLRKAFGDGYGGEMNIQVTCNSSGGHPCSQRGNAPLLKACEKQAFCVHRKSQIFELGAKTIVLHLYFCSFYIV